MKYTESSTGGRLFSGDPVISPVINSLRAGYRLLGYLVEIDTHLVLSFQASNNLPG